MTLVSIGIESSADKLGVGIVDSDGRILANKVRTYKPGIGKGVIPRDAAQHHADNVPELVRLALEDAKMGVEELDIISFTQGSGMGPCLRVDAVAARTLAIKFNKPIIGVNHQVAHVEIGKLIGNMQDPVVLYVSGGNSQVIALSEGRYRVFGETLDIPVGNCLDVFGREMHLDNSTKPMGAVIEDLAKMSMEHSGSFYELPYTVKGFDISFSGLLTAARRLAKSDNVELNDVCFSLQETAFAMLTEVTERALAHTGKDEVLVTGGVAANNRLKDMLGDMSKLHNARFVGLPAPVAIDNGAMIAWTGILMHQHGHIQSINDTLVRQRWRPEEVDLIWLQNELKHTI
ncbi:MAG: bifunctional N(6)-L-threonylcarbamoyladenine synthase/serine/threonine protein kinase [Candidatus Heimdallarchaeota archaeon]|nr:bifunctional N(6)-L-threonylcarbamoyladenine synthase/serine/threonine protein kinase [Candidatus Heimdallarchaeota archaeon]